MNLRWEEFEKPLNARLKSYDPRRDMSFWNYVYHCHRMQFTDRRPVEPDIGPFRIWPFLRGLASLCFLCALLAYRTDSQARLAPWESPNVAITFIGIWSLILTLFRSAFIVIAANSREQRILQCLPLRFEDVFRRLAIGCRAGLVYIFLETLLAFGCVAWSRGLSLPDLASGILCALLSCGFSLAISLLLLRSQNKISKKCSDALGFIVLAWMGLGCFLPLLLVDISTGTRWFFFLNPVGWFGEFYLAGGAWWTWPFAAASFALIATLPSSFRTIRETYRRDELRRITPPALPVSAADARRELLAGDFLNPSGWNDSGPIEKTLSAILSCDELSIAKSLLINPRSWLRKLDLFFVFTLLSALGHAIAAKMATRHFNQAVIGGLALFVLMMISAGSLFTMPIEVDGISYLPVRTFSLWKTSVKVNALVLSLMFVVCLAIPWSPVAVVSGTAGAGIITPLANAVELIAYFSFLPFWLAAETGARNSSTRSRNRNALHVFSIRYWTFVTQVGSGTMFVISGLFSILPKPVEPKFSLLPVAILVSIALSFYMERLEIAKWRKAAIRR